MLVHKYFFIILCIIYSFSLTAGEKNGFKYEKQSQNSIYNSILECQKPLTIDLFQDCSLKLFHSGKYIENAKVSISGGMQAHRHGLPTSPKVIWAEDQNIHVIKGLKFSMPGKWSLYFRVNAVEETLKDNILMEIKVK